MKLCKFFIKNSHFWAKKGYKSNSANWTNKS